MCVRVCIKLKPRGNSFVMDVTSELVLTCTVSHCLNKPGVSDQVTFHEEHRNIQTYTVDLHITDRNISKCR